MPKRFTDTEKWKKSFFKGLQAPYKIVWLYLLDDCNHAGVWEVEFDVLKIRTGINASINEVLNVFGEKIRVFDDGNKWFIKDFIEFQYGELNSKNRAHNSVLNLLLSYKNKGLTSPLEGVKDKDKNKDNDKDIYKKIKHLFITKEDNQKILDLGYSQKEIDSIYDSIENYKQNTKYISLYLTAKKWIIKEYGERKKPNKKIKFLEVDENYNG